MVRCPKCQKEMNSLKSYKYTGTEKNCQGKLSEQKPVKPHAKPKAKDKRQNLNPKLNRYITVKVAKKKMK